MSSIEAARKVRRRARRAYRTLKSVVRQPPLAPLGHYYSPLTNAHDAARAVGWAETTSLSEVNLDLVKMEALARRLAPMWAELGQTDRYRRDSMFELADAAVYSAMLREYQPSQVIEVGSGYSTAVALDTISAHRLSTRLSCIEPNPERLRSLLRDNDDVLLQQRLVQDVPLDYFDSLSAGDFLFIDSTHVVKAGSDVVWTTLRVLPRLQPGVLVHIHDMFWPLEYQEKWLRQRRDWNEIYLIHAFLSGNANWRILLFNDLVWRNQQDLVRQYLPAAASQRPGGLWLEKVG